MHRSSASGLTTKMKHFPCVERAKDSGKDDMKQDICVQ